MQKNSKGTVTNVISNSARNGLIPQKDYFDKDIANVENTAGYYIISKNDFVYNPRKSTDAPYGPISRYTYDKDGIVSPLYLCFHGNNDVNPEYFERFFKSSVWHRYIYMSGDSGARHDRVSIKDETFFEMPIHLPSDEEQKKIAAFLSLIEKKIEYQFALVENLKKYKRGLHDRIFSHLSDSKCEKADLRSIATFCGGGTPSKDVPSHWNGNIGWISSSDVHEEWVDTISVTRRINDIAISNSATKLCPSGTIAIVSRVGVGKVALMSEDLCTSQDFTNITSIKGNTLFMTYQIAYKMKIEAAKTQGTSIKGITAEEIKSLKIDMPADEEQRYIATLLSSLDIRLRQEIRKADCLHTLKNALLQQLFI